MLVVGGDGFYILYFFYHDAGLRLMLEHLLQIPKNQDPTVFGCGGAANFKLRIPDIWVSTTTEFAMVDVPDPILGVEMSWSKYAPPDLSYRFIG